MKSLHLPIALSLAVLLQGCATYSETASSSSETQGNEAACPQSRGWKAWINAMPGPGAVPALIVTGEVNVPAGREIYFEPGALDRMSPPAQRFILSSEAGNGPTGWQGVRAELKPALDEYRAIVIVCNGEAIAFIENIETAY